MSRVREWIDPTISFSRDDAMKAITRLINGRGMCIPMEDDDADRILANVIDERDRLRAAALTMVMADRFHWGMPEARIALRAVVHPTLMEENTARARIKLGEAEYDAYWAREIMREPWRVLVQ